MEKKSLKLNLFYNVIKQCCTIIFPLITFPYVSRVLGPESYGKYNFAYSYVNYFVILAALGVSTYSIREGAKIRNDKDKLEIFCDEVFTINCISMVLSFASLILLCYIWSDLDIYKELIFILGFSIVLNTIGADWINTIYEDFKYITFRYILFQVLSIILMFIFVKSAEDISTYCVISIIANSGANILNIFYTRKKYIAIRITKKMNFAFHIRPLIILLCNTLAVTIYVNSDITMLGIIRTDVEVGKYSVAVKIYTIIKQLINAITMVIIPRIAVCVGQNNQNEYNLILNQTVNGLIILLLPIIFIVGLLSRDAVLLVAGTQYIDAQYPLQILCYALFFSVLGCLFSNGVLIINNKEKVVLISTVISAIINILLNFSMIRYFGIIGSAITTVIAEMIVCVLSIYHSRKLWRFVLASQNMVSPIAGCVLIYALSRLTNKLNINFVIQDLIFLFIALVLYVLTLYFMKNTLLLNFIDSLKRRHNS